MDKGMPEIALVVNGIMALCEGRYKRWRWGGLSPKNWSRVMKVSITRACVDAAMLDDIIFGDCTQVYDEANNNE